jgi:uncharacterized protein YjcR
MANEKHVDRAYAKELYIHTTLTQGEIAKRCGVSPKTISVWVNEDNWAAEKEAMNMTVPRMVMELVRQLNELHTEVKSREPGKRYVDSKEAHIQSSLVRDIKNLQAGQNLSAYVQVAMEAENFIRGNQNYSNDFVQQFGLAMGEFVTHMTKILSPKK